MTSRLLNDLDRLERVLLNRQRGFRRDEQDGGSNDIDQERLRRMISTLGSAERDALMNLLRQGGSNAALNAGRRFRKRNYNLDHLARMNFRRSLRGNTAFNDRHILGGL